jgi:molybdenum cofactor guanylyltransferase
MKIAGCILAGGRSTRFGSDKALAILGGKTLLDHAIARLTPQIAELAINTNSTDAAFAQTGLPLISDATPDFRGPLAGILAALTWARSVKADAVVTVAVDTPLFPVDLAARLTGSAKTIAVAESASGLHPTCALWPVDIEPALSDGLATGKSLRVTDFLSAQSFEKIWFDAEDSLDPFFNVNFEGDAAIVEAHLRDGLDGQS